MAKQNDELKLLNLLRSVLPKAVPDPKLADKIYTALEKEISSKERVASFEKFCQRTELPDLAKKSLDEVQKQFETSFGKGSVSLLPHPQKKAVSVEVVTSAGTFEGVIKVGAVENNGEDDDEMKPKLVPFPVSLEADPELVWMLARDERMTPQEAMIALAKSQDSFGNQRRASSTCRNVSSAPFPNSSPKFPAKR